MQKAQEKAVEEMRPALEAAAKEAAGYFLRFTSKGLEGIDTSTSQGSFYGAVKDLWSKVFSVAVLLFPLAVLLNIASVLVSGVSAPVARAEMLESLVRSLLILGVSAGSFLITGSMVKIAWGAAAVVMGESVAGNGSYLQGLLIKLATSGLSSSTLQSMLAIFISLTIIFLILAAISALILSYFALLALTVGMVVVAPLVSVVGGIPEFHWVYGTWIRAFVGVLLVPLANAILFKMLSVFSLQGKSIVDILVGMGFLCIIVAVNFYAGKLVFSPAIEAGKMAADSMFLLFQLGTAAIGLVAGVAGLGAVGAGIGAAGSAGASAGRNATQGGPSGSGGGSPEGGATPGGDGGNNGFQGRVNEWRKRPPEERQEAMASLEQQSFQNQAQGQLAQSLVGRDPFLRAAASVWGTARQSGLAYERSAIRAADQMERNLQGENSFPSPPAAPHSTHMPGSSVPSLGPAPASVASHTASYLPATGAASALPGGLGSRPGLPGRMLALPPGSSGIYPALFGNPAYDDQGLQARGWSPDYQVNLHENIQGLYQTAQTAAERSNLPHAQVIFDPLVAREISAGPSGVRVTPEIFQAAAVRYSAGWLSQPVVTQNLPGANIMERAAAEQVLVEVSQRLGNEPLGRLAGSILSTGQEAHAHRSPAEFWTRVIEKLRR